MAQFGVDVFTGTDTTELTVYSANWAKQTGNTGNVSISNANRAHGVTVSGNGSYIWQGGSPASADYTVAADVIAIGTVTGVTAGVQGRAVAAANTAYVARHLAGTGWQLQKVVAGVTTNLGTAGVATLTLSQVYRLTLSMVGSTITLNVDGTDLVSVTDTAITAAGAAGLRCFGQSGNANGEHLDNFSADDAGGGSPGTASGDTVTATTTATGGAASGDAVAAAATVTATASATGGAATGAAAAPGATITASSSTIPGSATGAAVAGGNTVVATTSAIGGTASGGGAATAPGATVTAAASTLPGSARGAASAGSALVSAASSFIAGAVSGAAAAQAALVIATAQAIGGSADGGGAISTIGRPGDVGAVVKAARGADASPAYFPVRKGAISTAQ